MNQYSSGYCEQLDQNDSRVVQYSLLVPIALSNIACRCAPLATTAIEGNFLVMPRLVEAKLLLESLRSQVKRFWQDSEGNVDCRGNHPLSDFIRFPHINKESILPAIE